MMKSPVLAIVAATACSAGLIGCAVESLERTTITALNATDDQQRQIIDLDEPGEFDSLRRSNPEHFATIEEILKSIQKRRVENVPRWLQTDFDAGNVSYTPVLLITDPPKRRLALTLDDTRYRMTFVLTEDRARPQLLLYEERN